MIHNVEALAFDQLEAQLSEKAAEFEKAFEDGSSVTELNEIYKQLKTLQIELNLRKIASVSS
jgi:hypothetical protein